MSGYILRGGQENMTLPASAVESLLKRGEGDAALLYLALQRFGRGVTPEELARSLKRLAQDSEKLAYRRYVEERGEKPAL